MLAVCLVGQAAADGRSPATALRSFAQAAKPATECDKEAGRHCQEASQVKLSMCQVSTDPDTCRRNVVEDYGSCRRDAGCLGSEHQ